MKPMLNARTPADWWFAFKFNAETFQSTARSEPVHAIFGGRPNAYPDGFCLQYAVASDTAPSLVSGGDADIGTSLDDPLGATFDQIYNGTCNFVLWNDQFYGSPIASKGSPWGHSKGALAWDDAGNGFVLQVSTPSWPGSGSANSPRANDGNTLGCVTDDDIEVSQHFFALSLKADGIAAVLEALAHASVVTDPTVAQLCRLTDQCPARLRDLVGQLGKEEGDGQAGVTKVALTSQAGQTVTLIAKPSALHVPPWQMVSSLLGGVDLCVASWWTNPKIPSTPAGRMCGCWDESLKTKPGAVTIATAGHWAGKEIGLTGGRGKMFNHAKIGVTAQEGSTRSIFGDLNQQGTLDGDEAGAEGCKSSQNGRGGMFFVLDNQPLHDAIKALIS